MKGATVSFIPPQVDISAPEGDVEIEVDVARGVLYVHIEGFTCLRICQIKGMVSMLGKRENGEQNSYLHNVGGE